MSDTTKSQVFKAVKLCFRFLVGRSGHVAGYRLLESTFKITGKKGLKGGLTEYGFTVVGEYMSEFSGEMTEGGMTNTDLSKPSEELKGKIVLDSLFNLTRKKSGKIRLSPWDCLDPDKAGQQRGTSSGKKNIVTLSDRDKEVLVRAMGIIKGESDE